MSLIEPPIPLHLQLLPIRSSPLVQAMETKFVFHVLGGDFSFRAAQSRLILESGFHAELYANLAEVLSTPPKSGALLINADGFAGGIEVVGQILADRGIWLPFIAIGERPSVAQVVDSMRAGSFDYLEVPLSSSKLRRVADDVLGEKGRIIELRRRRIDALERLRKLTAREREVLECVTNGLPNKVIGRALDISTRTVETHRANMLGKLGVASIVEATRLKLEADGGVPATAEGRDPMNSDLSGKLFDFPFLPIRRETS